MNITYEKTVEDIFNSINVKYQKRETNDEKKYIYKCSVELGEKERVLKKIGTVNFVFALDLIDCSILMISSPIYSVSDRLRVELLEVINKLNLGTIYGTYVLDKNNKVRYCISGGVTSKCEELSEELINNYISNLVLSVNKAILKIVDTLKEKKKESENE